MLGMEECDGLAEAREEMLAGCRCAQPYRQTKECAFKIY